jgi:hypothetical protein
MPTGAAAASWWLHKGGAVPYRSRSRGNHQRVSAASTSVVRLSASMAFPSRSWRSGDMLPLDSSAAAAQTKEARSNGTAKSCATQALIPSIARQRTRYVH